MLTLKTAPLVEPVLGSDVRAYLRMDSTAYDTVLGNYATAARQAAEKWTRRSFIDTSWYLMLEDYEVYPDIIKLPRPPLDSITTITTYDWAGVGHVQDPLSYVTDTYSEPGRVFLNIGRIWNVPRRQNNAMLIDYKSGYGAAATDVPMDIKLAITETAAWWYNSGEITDIPQKVTERLQPYRVLWF